MHPVLAHLSVFATYLFCMLMPVVVLRWVAAEHEKSSPVGLSAFLASVKAPVGTFLHAAMHGRPLLRWVAWANMVFVAAAIGVLISIMQNTTREAEADFSWAQSEISKLKASELTPEQTADLRRQISYLQQKNAAPLWTSGRRDEKYKLWQNAGMLVNLMKDGSLTAEEYRRWIQSWRYRYPENV